MRFPWSRPKPIAVLDVSRFDHVMFEQARLDLEASGYVVLQSINPRADSVVVHNGPAPMTRGEDYRESLAPDAPALPKEISEELGRYAERLEQITNRLGGLPAVALVDKLSTPTFPLPRRAKPRRKVRRKRARR